MNKINYQKILEETIKSNENESNKQRLLLHACCAPCSSYVLEYLNKYFQITVLFYNPNISSREEYQHRENELKRLIDEMPFVNNVELICEPYNHETFLEETKGLYDAKEGGERCYKCYEQRLRKTADIAKNKKFDFFTTTLSISPLKNSQKLNEIGKKLEDEYNIKYLYSDFKKKEGYKRSIELSKEYNLYRQNFCGCEFSKRDHSNLQNK